MSSLLFFLYMCVEEKNCYFRSCTLSGQNLKALKTDKLHDLQSLMILSLGIHSLQRRRAEELNLFLQSPHKHDKWRLLWEGFSRLFSLGFPLDMRKGPSSVATRGACWLATGMPVTAGCVATAAVRPSLHSCSNLPVAGKVMGKTVPKAWNFCFPWISPQTVGFLPALPPLRSG